MPAVLVTGASTGIGEACALHLNELGHLVFAGVRREVDGESIERRSGGAIVPLMLDVTDQDAIDAAVETVGRRSGRLRFAGLVNNAGIARGGPIEYLPLDEWREQLEVNVVAQVAVTRAFLPLVRSGCGRIVFMGSIGGRVAAPLLGPYSASKFALEAVAESLRRELHDWDLKVSLVEPGPVKTPIWDKAGDTNARLKAEADPEMLVRYGGLIERLENTVARNDRTGVEPVAVARAVEHALFAERPRQRYLVGPDARVAALMARLVPDRFQDVLVRTFN